MLLKINMTSNEVIAYHDMAHIYNGSLVAQIDNYFIEFGAVSSKAININDFTEDKRPGLTFQFALPYTFLQLRDYILILYDNMLYLLDLKSFNIDPIVKFGFQIAGYLFLQDERTIGIVSDTSDDLVLYNTIENTMQSLELPIEAGQGEALPLCSQNVLLLGVLGTRNSMVDVSLTYMQFQTIRNMRSSIAYCKPGLSSQRLYVIDDAGLLCIFKWEKFRHYHGLLQKACIKPPTVQSLVQPLGSAKKSRYEVFLGILYKYISNYKAENDRSHNDRNIVVTCNKILQLIKASQQYVNSSTNIKQQYLDIITLATKENDQKYMYLYSDIYFKQQMLRDITERICILYNYLVNKNQAEMELAQQDIKLKKNMEELMAQQEVKLYREEKLQQLRVEIEQMKYEQERKRMLDEQRMLQKYQYEEIEQYRKKLEQEKRELEQARDYVKKKQTHKEKKAFEQKYQHIMQEEERILYLKKYEEKAQEQYMEQERRYRQEQRKKEIEAERARGQVRAKTSGLHINQYYLVSTGPGCVFYVSGREMLIRYGYYLMLIGIQTYQIKKILTLNLYQEGVPVSYYNGIFVEYLPDRPFSVNVAEDFEKVEMEGHDDQYAECANSLDFAYYGKNLYVLNNSGKLVQIDVVGQKIATVKPAVGYDRVFVLGEKLVVANDHEATEGTEMHKCYFREEYGRYNVEELCNGKLLSFNENKVYCGNEEIYSSINNVDKSQPCCVGNVCTIVDDGGILTTFVFE